MYKFVLLGLALLPALLAGPADAARTWRGHTTQGYAIRAVLSPSGSLVTLLRTQSALDCSDGTTALRRLVFSRDAGDTLVVRNDGRFTTSGTIASGLPSKGSGSLTYKLSGRVRANRITGTLRVDYALDSGVGCTTELVGYSLR